MVTHQQHQDEKWDKVMENLDLLFARVTKISSTQQQLQPQMDINSQAEVVQQPLCDQHLMVKQIAATGKAVACLTLEHMDAGTEDKSPKFLAPVSSKGTALPLFDEMPLEDDAAKLAEKIIYSAPGIFKSAAPVVLDEISVSYDVAPAPPTDQLMFKASVASNRVIYEVFDEVPSQVVWDEDVPFNLVSYDSLLQLVDPNTECHIGEDNALLDKASMDEFALDSGASLLFQFDRDTVIWDEEMMHNASSHAGLLQQLASRNSDLDLHANLLQQVAEFSEKSILVVEPANDDMFSNHRHPQSLQLGRDAVYEVFIETSLEEKLAAKAKQRDNVVQVLFDEMPCENVVGDKTSTNLVHEGLLQQLALGKEYMNVPLVVGIDSRAGLSGEIPCEIWTEHILYDLVPHGSLLQQQAIGATDMENENNKSMVKLIEDELLPVVDIFQLCRSMA